MKKKLKFFIAIVAPLVFAYNVLTQEGFWKYVCLGMLTAGMIISWLLDELEEGYDEIQGS